MLEAANPQLNNPDALEIGQKLNVPIGANYGTEPTPNNILIDKNDNA